MNFIEGFSYLVVVLEDRVLEKEPIYRIGEFLPRANIHAEVLAVCCLVLFYLFQKSSVCTDGIIGSIEVKVVFAASRQQYNTAAYTYQNEGICRVVCALSLTLKSQRIFYY